MFCSISWLHLNKFAPNFQNRAHFFVMMKKMGNNPIQTWKLYVLFHFLTPSKWICFKLSQHDSFFHDNQKRANNPILTSKLYCVISCISQEQNLFLNFETSFCQFPTWLLPGLRYNWLHIRTNRMRILHAKIKIVCFVLFLDAI